jgi:hypothetical protein
VLRKVSRIISLRLAFQSALTVCALATFSVSSVGQIAIDQLVPSSAKGFVTVPDAKRLEENWERTTVSNVFKEESMQPFVDSLESQLNRRFATTGIRIGLSLTDLRDVCSGEAALAFLQPKDEAQKHAIAALANVEGNDEEVEALLAKIDKTMEQREAERSEGKIGAVPAIVYEVPTKRGAKKTFSAIVIHHDGMLVATDHVQVAKQIAENLENPGTNSLSDLTAYKETMRRAEAAAAGVEPDIRWFLEPIAYAELAREYAIRKKRRRTDVLAAMKNQGFDALRGAGGYVSFATKDFEILQHAYVYAPAIKAAGDAKYEKAAAMMAFPVQGNHEVEDWIPTSVGSYVSARWGIKESYNHIGGLVDEVAGEEGFFEDLIDSLENDPNGPQINLEKEIVAHLGERVTVITNTQKPITVSSERFFVAIDLTDAKAMNESLEKALANDPDARRVDYKDHVIWEIVNEDEEMDIVEVEIGGFGDLEGFDDEDFDEEEDDANPLLSNAAISVVKGCFVVSSHLEFVKEIIDTTTDDDGLDDDADYLAMRQALQQIGDGPGVSTRLFTRARRELEASYELVRTGKMPDSEGLIGRMLNRFLGANEKDVVREQQVDGEEMPDYSVISKYIGTAGLYIRTEEDGWYVGGLALQAAKPELHGSRPALTTAAADDSSTIEN